MNLSIFNRYFYMDLCAICYELEVNFLFRFFEFQTSVKPLIRTKRYFHSCLPISVSDIIHLLRLYTVDKSDSV